MFHLRKKYQIVKGYWGSAKQLLLLVFSTYIMLRFLHNLFFLIFLFGLGFGASNKKEIKKLKKKVKLMEHIIGNIHDCIAYLYAWCLCAGNNHAIYQITIYLFHKIYLYIFLLFAITTRCPWDIVILRHIMVKVK